jgi:shikimate kinase
MREQNRALLRSYGYVVYLNASLREQTRRTGKDRNRPLLAGKNRPQVLGQLMEIRDPLYREVADLVLPTDNKSASVLADKIITELA